MRWVEICGWYGVIGVLFAYALVTFQFVEGTNVWYQLINFTASMGLGIISIKKKAYFLSGFYFIWTGIALISIVIFVI